MDTLPEELTRYPTDDELASMDIITFNRVRKELSLSSATVNHIRSLRRKIKARKYTRDYRIRNGITAIRRNVY